MRKEKQLPDTHIETDSYVTVQLLQKSDKLDFDSLKDMAEAVEGNFTFTVLDQNNNLYIIKGSNPMCLLHFPALGLYVYASTESIMKNALKRVGLHKFAMERITIDEGDILSIDSSGNITRSEFESKIYRSKYGKWYDYDDSSYYNMHEELLLATVAVTELIPQTLNSCLSTVTLAMKSRRCSRITACSMKLSGM